MATSDTVDRMAAISASRLAALLHADPASGVRPGPRPAAAYRQLTEGLRRLVVDGQVLVGSRLPSERDLTASLGVSRTTVASAYAALRDAGYLTTRRGSGSVVTLPEGGLRRGAAPGVYPVDIEGDDLDLTCAATRAPHGMARAYESALAALPSYLATAGYLTLGVPDLRAAIAQRYTARGLPTTPEEILVTSGAVAGMSIAMSAFLAPGDGVLVESPTYPNTVHALRHRGIRLSATPVTSAGWDVDNITQQLRGARIRAALLVPDFHNPTGAHLDDAGRADVAAALRRGKTLALVDETMAELALDPDSPRARPMAAFHHDTVTIGSAGKSHWGGLRLGWIRAPRHVLDPLLAARVSVDLGAAVLEQLVLLELLRAEPGMAAARRTELRAARDVLVAALRDRLPQAEFTVPAGGLCLWVRLPGLDTEAVVARAEREGVYLAAGRRFAVTGTLEHWLRIPYVLPPQDLVDAVDRLARAVDQVATVRRPRRRDRPQETRPLIA